MVAVGGLWKAKCECNGTWGLGETEEEAEKALIKNTKEEQEKWQKER